MFKYCNHFVWFVTSLTRIFLLPLFTPPMLSFSIQQDIDNADQNFKNLMNCLTRSNNSIMVPNLIKHGIIPKVCRIIQNSISINDTLTALCILKNILIKKYQRELQPVMQILPNLMNLLDISHFYEIVIQIISRMTMFWMSANELVGNYGYYRFLSKMAALVHPTQKPSVLADLANILIEFGNVGYSRDGTGPIMLPALCILSSYQQCPKLINKANDLLLTLDINSLLQCTNYTSQTVEKYICVCEESQWIFNHAIANMCRSLKIKPVNPDVSEQIFRYYTLFHPKATIRRIRMYNTPIANLIYSLGSPFKSTKHNSIVCLNKVINLLTAEQIIALDQKYRLFHWLTLFLVGSILYATDLKHVCWSITHILILFKQKPLQIVNTDMFKTVLKIIKSAERGASECSWILTNAIFIGQADAYNEVMIQHKCIVDLIKILESHLKAPTTAPLLLQTLEVIHCYTMFNANDLRFRKQCDSTRLTELLECIATNLQNDVPEYEAIHQVTCSILNDISYS